MSDRVVVPASLAASHVRYSGEAGRRWVAALPDLADRWLRRWDLRPDGPAGCGAVALVLPVVRADGTAAALKLQPVDDETRGEAEALTCWAGRGAVALLEHDAASGSLLLERLDASRPLSLLADDLAACAVIARLLGQLTTVRAPAGMRRLADVAGRTLAEVPAAVLRAADPVERALLLRCAGLLRELLEEPVADRLLHWDLHHANVLAMIGAGDPGWRAIDPKPLSGDPAFELLPALWNRWDAVVAGGDAPAAVLRRFDVMCEVLRLDRVRATAWTCARVLQNACWDLVSGRAGTLGVEQRTIAETLLARRLPQGAGRLS